MALDRTPGRKQEFRTQERGCLRWGEEATGLLALLQSSTLLGNLQTFWLEKIHGVCISELTGLRKEGSNSPDWRERAAVENTQWKTDAPSACLVS